MPEKHDHSHISQLIVIIITDTQRDRFVFKISVTIVTYPVSVKILLNTVLCNYCCFS